MTTVPADLLWFSRGCRFLRRSLACLGRGLRMGVGVHLLSNLVGHLRECQHHGVDTELTAIGGYRQIFQLGLRLANFVECHIG